MVRFHCPTTAEREEITKRRRKGAKIASKEAYHWYERASTVLVSRMLDKIRVLSVTDGRIKNCGFGIGDENFVKAQVKTSSLPGENELLEIEFPGRQNEYPDTVCVLIAI